MTGIHPTSGRRLTGRALDCPLIILSPLGMAAPVTTLTQTPPDRPQTLRTEIQVLNGTAT